MNQPDQFRPGDICTCTGIGDMGMDPDARKFIGARCVVVKTTRAGLIQVRLESDSRAVYSLPKYSLGLNPWR